jgi:hypothetical protein
MYTTSPLFALEAMTCFAYDASIIRNNKVLENLIINVQKSLEAITKWLKKSGLKLNQNNVTVKSKNMTGMDRFQDCCKA